MKNQENYIKKKMYSIYILKKKKKTHALVWQSGNGCIILSTLQRNLNPKEGKEGSGEGR